MSESGFERSVVAKAFAGEVSPRLQIGIFIAAIFLSSVLLFSIQPMFTKMVLPRLGGSPSVWAISMCFFQAMLLAGYGYAHALHKHLSPARAFQAHITLMALTCLALPIGLPTSLSEPPAGDAYLWTLGILALGVGLPFFAVSANAPLLQAWFARSGNSAARDPYFLYAASNLGSLLALLAYPIVVERAFGLPMQAQLWSAGFILLAATIVACAAAGRILGSGDRPAAHLDAGEAAGAVTSSQRLLWVALAFVPSGLVVGVTTYVSTDVASAPFLWVVPLALFLATFIVVFREKLAFPYTWLHGLLPVAAITVVLAETSTRYQALALLAAVAGFFIASLICHRELYLRRPDARHLTEFYTWMSVGGVLGGIFAALLAPKIFASALEFKLLLLSALVLRPGVVLGRETPLSLRRLAAITLAALAIFTTYKLAVSQLGAADVAPYALMAVVIAALVAIRQWPEHSLAVVVTAVLAATFKPGDTQTIHLERSFFGTHRVALHDGGTAHALLHGTTIHGYERIREPDGKPSLAPTPATYYHAAAPMARALRAVREMRGGSPVNLAVVGLGAGSMACHTAPADTLTYFEIDPSVVSIARDRSLFTFLSRCAPKAEIVVGDARLTLQKVAPKSLDYLVIDAFSSDSIPMHLLTAEALSMYLTKIADDGVIALHVSNRYLDLVPALTATLDHLRVDDRLVVRWTPQATDRDAAPSHVVLLAKRPEPIAAARAWPGAAPMTDHSSSAWTDDYSDILSALIAKLRQ